MFTAPGQISRAVGPWVGDGTDNEFDDSSVRDIAGPYVADARWFTDQGAAQVDASDSNVLELPQIVEREAHAVRRGSRRDYYAATVKWEWNGSSEPGLLVRWLSPGDWLAVGLSPTDGKVRLYRRKSDGTFEILATGGTTVNLSTSTWYTMKVLVDESSGQRLQVWVDTDRDGDFGDETVLLTDTTYIDADWSGGYVGVFRGRPTTSTTKFDDFKLVDASGQTEVVLIDDDFASNQVTLTYDNNGNLTNDGIFQYVYDAWNRLVEVLLKEGTDETTIATYAYDAQNRRLTKAVTNSGAEAIEGDGGNTTVHYYYSNQWQILETRNGSNQATRQWVWGFQYVDEPIFMDVNRAPTHGNDCDPDVEEGGGNNDARYYYQQDRNWNVVAVLESDFPAASGYAAGVAGRVAERYAYTPYGEFVVLRGDGGSGQLGNVLNTSYVGSPFAHQGLGWDAEKVSYQNRWREYPAGLQRFAVRIAPNANGAWATSNYLAPSGTIPQALDETLGVGGQVCVDSSCAGTILNGVVMPENPPPLSVPFPPAGQCRPADGMRHNGRVHKVPDGCTITIFCGPQGPYTICGGLCRLPGLGCQLCPSGTTYCEPVCVDWDCVEAAGSLHLVCLQWEQRQVSPFNQWGLPCGSCITY